MEAEADVGDRRNLGSLEFVALVCEYGEGFLFPPCPFAADSAADGATHLNYLRCCVVRFDGVDFLRYIHVFKFPNG